MTRHAIARLALTISAVVASGAPVPTPTIQQSLRPGQCEQPVPAGFSPLDLLSWNGPWVFDEGKSATAALPALDNASGQRTNGPVRIRLDDGTEGALRVSSRPCGATEGCTPLDCGCPLESESYWIEIMTAGGAVVSRMHLWAAYGMFQIVPVDLIDGPGDELVIVRVPAHASPPIGYDLKIWKIGPTKPIELGARERVAGGLVTDPIACARWRSTLSVDRTAPKPRPITLRTQFGSTGCCRMAAEETERVADMRRPRILQFDAAAGGYRAR